MIDVTEADKIISETILERRLIPVPLQKAMGRVLMEDILADNDFPPFDRVMMDGIAIDYSAYEKGKRSFFIENMQPAGMPQMQLSSSENCIEVMTGTILPGNTNVVVPYEQVEIDGDKKTAHVRAESLEVGKNIHRQGTDKSRGDLLIAKGAKIAAPEIAIMASVGKVSVKVTQNPTIAIISTGNELVDIDEQPLPHQIRRSNVYALQAEVNRLGLAADLYHIDDDRDVLLGRLSEVLESHDVLLLSGGVSMGKFDYVPHILQELGVEMKFHKIRQKPGKPFWFGVRGNEKVIFAFPGNPVSTFMCFHRYFVPWFLRQSGLSHSTQEYAVLAEDFNVETPFTFFLQVALFQDEAGTLQARPITGRGSGDHANLLQADGFLQLQKQRHTFSRGEKFPLYRFR